MSTRDDIVANALWGADNEPQIHYTMGDHRADGLNAPPRTLPLYTDCSGFVTLLYKWAGAPDPNGLDYVRLGFTGTLLMHLSEISLGVAQPADLIVYGPGLGDHVVVVIEPGDDPLCVSHGQEAGPIRVRHSVEARAHKPPVRVLRGLDVTPPPEDDMFTDDDRKLLQNVQALLATTAPDLGGNVRDLVNDGFGKLTKPGEIGDVLRVAAVQTALKQIYGLPTDATLPELRAAIKADLG